MKHRKSIATQVACSWAQHFSLEPSAAISGNPHTCALLSRLGTVAGCFVMAMISWGLCFYGTGLYLAYLVQQRGMPIAGASFGITAYFWLSAVMITSCGPLIDRAGPRLSVSVGAVAMTLAVSAIARVEGSVL